MYKVKSLFHYPVKSFGGTQVSTLNIGPRGPMWDRNWMLVDKENQVVTQVEYPTMSQVKAQLVDDARVELHAPGIEFMDYGVEEGSDTESLKVKIENDTCEAQEVEPEVSEWVSDFLGAKLRLVRMKDDFVRAIGEKYGEGQTSFSDGFPFLILSNESMDLLNSKLGKAMSVSRFRPNIVVSVSEPHEEDTWTYVQVGEVVFRGVKLCARSKMITIQPLTGEFGEEPLQTLSSYRETDMGIVFGKYFVHENQGEIRTGMPISFP